MVDHSLSVIIKKMVESINHSVCDDLITGDGERDGDGDDDGDNDGDNMSGDDIHCSRRLAAIIHVKQTAGC